MRKLCESSNCGSRSFHLGEDGFTYCSEGHRQTQIGLATGEDDGVRPAGRRTILKSQEQATLLTGKEGIEHYLLCFQLILRKQVYALVHEQGFPAELETIVHDLWLLRLTTLQDRLRTSADDQGDDSRRLFSSQDPSGERDDPASSRPAKADSLPTILDAVALVYTGILLLRLPVTTHDVHSMIQSGRLLYYRSSHELSQGMKSRLHGLYHSRLDPTMQLTTKRLQSSLRNNIDLFKDSFGLAIPPFNYALHLFRLVKEFGLPIEVYNGSLCLIRLVGLDFSFDGPLSHSIGTPEEQLSAIVIVTTKLFFPFDTHDRVPQRGTEPAALRIDWASWLRTMSRKEKPADKPQDPYAAAMNAQEADVLDMTNDQMDDYMSWFQDAYLKDEEQPSRGKAADVNFAQTLRDLFPLAERKPHAPSSPQAGAELAEVDDKVRATQGSLESVRPLVRTAGDEDVSRPGSEYRRYRKLEELQGHIRGFFNVVASVTGVEVAVLVERTYEMERLVQRNVQ